ncbi:MAG: hypothetical protein DRJ52_09455 [Thermoprotei archaeon]|nr:MAG: hypothetical protein DRJ52_09455 [Thermoprotei archaeon]HDD33817.1 hypothetical protein [Thermofilaceae archaeon]
MPVPSYIVEKATGKMTSKYCSYLKTIFPELDVSACEAGYGRIVREKWPRNYEAGLRAFLHTIGAL